MNDTNEYFFLPNVYSKNTNVRQFALMIDHFEQTIVRRCNWLCVSMQIALLYVSNTPLIVILCNWLSIGVND